MDGKTLEELITDCGDDFIALEKFGNEWFARAAINKNTLPIREMKLSSTMKEAVYKLYLALHA